MTNLDGHQARLVTKKQRDLGFDAPSELLILC